MWKAELFIKLVIFSITDNKLKVLLKDNRLPLGELEESPSLDKAAKRILEKKIDIRLEDSFLEQLYTVSYPDEIDIVYYILKHSDSIPKEKLKSFFSWEKIAKNIKDAEIVRYAVQRLRWKIEYTNVVYSLLPQEFTLSQLQKTYEAILGESLDKRNFRKKILSLKLLKSTRHKKMIGRARPAEMFSFRKRELTFVKILQPTD
ncbi:hypothetical protein HZB96_03170 [Candidatus Gottesmanbacteria bacterium]|nr:hypothetical protein [Candidatus Gottesmanbacteria bacterium]